MRGAVSVDAGLRPCGQTSFYARIGVGLTWYVDPDARVLTVGRIQDGRWVELGVFAGDTKLRAEPFEAVEIDLSEWWAGVDAPEGSSP